MRNRALAIAGLAVLSFAPAGLADPPAPSAPFRGPGTGFFKIHALPLTNDGDRCVSTRPVDSGQTYGSVSYKARLVQVDCPSFTGTQWSIRTRDGRPWNGRSSADVSIQVRNTDLCVTNPDNYVPNQPTPFEDQTLWTFVCKSPEENRLVGIRQLHRIERSGQDGIWTIRSLLKDELTGPAGPDENPFAYWMIGEDNLIHYRDRNQGTYGEFFFTPVE